MFRMQIFFTLLGYTLYLLEPATKFIGAKISEGKFIYDSLSTVKLGKWRENLTTQL